MVVITDLDRLVMFSAVLPRKIFMSIAVERRIEKYRILSCKVKANKSTHPHYRDIGIHSYTTGAAEH